MSETILSKTVGKLCSVLGLLALVGCIGWVGFWSYFQHGPSVTPESCSESIKDPERESAKAADEAGAVRIVGVWPENTTINRRICVAVAGVAAKADETQSKQNAARTPVEITLFLNGRKTSDMTFKAKAIPDTQYLVSVREDIESIESVVVQEWRADSWGHDVDATEPQTL